MAQTCALAGLDPKAVTLFVTVLKAAGIPERPALAGLDVADLGKRLPTFLVCDLDGIDVDKLELLRQIRFVLPECVIGVYTEVIDRAWGLECHLAGANCMLSKDTGAAKLADGVRNAIANGCYTDPQFAA